MAKADFADAYEQLPLLVRDELSAVGAPKIPPDGTWCGFVSNAQLFGSTAAVQGDSFG